MKKVLISLSLAVFMAVISFIGLSKSPEVNADSSPVVEMIYESNKDINKSVYDKKNELKESAADVVIGKVKESISGKVEEEKAENTDELEQYFNEKINTIEDTPQYKAIENQVGSTADNMVENYKKELDAAVLEILGQ